MTTVTMGSLRRLFTKGNGAEWSVHQGNEPPVLFLGSVWQSGVLPCPSNVTLRRLAPLQRQRGGGSTRTSDSGSNAVVTPFASTFEQKKTNDSRCISVTR